MCDIIEKLGMTPGPWKVIKKKDKFSKRICVDSIRTNDFESDLMGDYRGCIIADFNKSHGEREHAFNEAERNAFLISAAPEMFKSFIDACDMICSLCIRLNPQHKDCPSCEDLDDLRKPIEKAANMSWEKLKELL